MIQLIDHNYTPRGSALELFGCRAPFVLHEGPAGTGKTRADLEFANYLAEKYPGMRTLLTRATRASMNESVLNTFEEKVLLPDSPLLTGAQRQTRQHYSYPNGSRIVLSGLDKPDRTFSMEFDLIIVHEAHEIRSDHYFKLHRCLRNGKMPWQQIILETNPEARTHWINRHFIHAAEDSEKARSHRRLKSRHEDNPSLTEAYLDALRNLPEPLRSRMYEGKWVSAEGLVYPNWDPEKHLIYRSEAPTSYDYFFGAMDFGFTDAGVFQVWGVHDGCMYRVAEIYRTKKTLEWWSDRIVQLDNEFDLLHVVADPSQPGMIQSLNDRLLGHGKVKPSEVRIGRLAPGERDGMAGIVRKANNAIEPGTDMVRWALGDADVYQQPRMFFLHDALRFGEDPDLKAAGMPTSSVREFDAYVFEKDKKTEEMKENPDPRCVDHGMDTTRYAAMDVWKKEIGRKSQPRRYAPGTMGHELGHNKMLGGS